MENKIVLSENKILEHNEKAFNDTIQLLSNVKEDNLLNDIKRAEESKEYLGVLPSMHLDKGRTIWLELKVEDSYLSGLIMSWMYSKSKYDNTSGLQAMGCTLNSIMFSKPSDFTDDERDAIAKLYDKVIGVKN